MSSTYRCVHATVWSPSFGRQEVLWGPAQLLSCTQWRARCWAQGLLREKALNTGELLRQHKALKERHEVVAAELDRERSAREDAAAEVKAAKQSVAESAKCDSCHATRSRAHSSAGGIRFLRPLQTLLPCFGLASYAMPSHARHHLILLLMGKLLPTSSPLRRKFPSR